MCNVINIGIKKEYCFKFALFSPDFYIYKNVNLNNFPNKIKILLETYNIKNNKNNKNNINNLDGDYIFEFLEKLSYENTICNSEDKYNNSEDKYNNCEYQLCYKSLINIGINQIFYGEDDYYFAYTNVNLDDFTESEVKLLEYYNNCGISDDPKFDFVVKYNTSTKIDYKKCKYFFNFMIH